MYTLVWAIISFIVFASGKQLSRVAECCSSGVVGIQNDIWLVEHHFFNQTMWKHSLHARLYYSSEFGTLEGYITSPIQQGRQSSFHKEDERKWTQSYSCYVDQDNLCKFNIIREHIANI